MTQQYTFKTATIWHDSKGRECETEVRVTYTHHRGTPATMIDPAEEPSVEIVSIVPVDPSVTLPDAYDAGDFDDAFHNECFEHYADEMEAAAEWQAQSRRDSMMGGF